MKEMKDLGSDMLSSQDGEGHEGHDDRVVQVEEGPLHASKSMHLRLLAPAPAAPAAPASASVAPSGEDVAASEKKADGADSDFSESDDGGGVGGKSPGQVLVTLIVLHACNCLAHSCMIATVSPFSGCAIVERSRPPC